MASISFLGSAGEVGRSALLVQDQRSKTLLDCGIKFEKGEEFPFLSRKTIRGLNTVALSHAHLDHSGYLPALYAAGYRGKVVMTKPSRDLIQLLLADYLRINKDFSPYTQRDVKTLLAKTAMTGYGEALKNVTLRNAGHILGSAMIELRLGRKNLLYTGDFNTHDSRLLEGATQGLKADALVIESTYGGNKDKHASVKEATRYLAQSIKKTFARHGKVIIPTFAIGRGQELLFTLENLLRSGALPESPVFTDGMVNKALRIYRHNAIDLKKEIQHRILTSDDDPFKSKYYKVPETRDRSDVFAKPRAIIVCTGGMLNGGPVLSYIKKLGPHKQNKIVLVGYQARGTRGRELLEGADELEIDRERVAINMEVDQAHFSAHSDQGELLDFVKNVRGLKKVFVIHGEPDKSRELAGALQNKFKRLQVEVPKNGEEYRL